MYRERATFATRVCSDNAWNGLKAAFPKFRAVNARDLIMGTREAVPSPQESLIPGPDDAGGTRCSMIACLSWRMRSSSRVYSTLRPTLRDSTRQMPTRIAICCLCPGMSGPRLRAVIDAEWLHVDEHPLHARNSRAYRRLHLAADDVRFL